MLATVKGDVHDIGKNLVDIILTNNGYKVVNLGIKQPLNDIMKAVEEHDADAVGMSGLLVKSTVIMRENLEEMSRQGFKVPVILGGAALTRQYVEEDCAQAYETGAVAYARDAFDGLTLMAQVKTGTIGQRAEAEQATGTDGASAGLRLWLWLRASSRHLRRDKGSKGKKRREREAQAANDAYATMDPEELRQRRIELAGNEAAAGAAVLGPDRARPRARAHRAALPERADALPVPVGLPEAGPQAERVHEVGQDRAAGRS